MTTSNSSENTSIGPELLNTRVRVASWAIGLSAGGGGITALFQNRPEGGTVALFAIGSVFLLMGVTGHGIRSVKFRDTEVILNTVAAARQLRSVGNEEAAEELVVDLVAGRTPSTPVAASPIQSKMKSNVDAAQLYEGRVQSLLIQFLADKALFLANPPSGSRFDSLIQIGGRTVAIEIRTGTRFPATHVADILGGKVRRSDVRIDGLLVIVNCDPHDSILRRLDSALDYLDIPKLVWGWSDSLEPVILKDGLDRILQEVGSEG